MENPSKKQATTSEPKDRLSDLPDAILLHILNLLDDTKSAAQTSVLSKRWRRVWVSLPDLNFDSTLFSDPSAFDCFVRAVLLQRPRNIEVRKFRLFFEEPFVIDSDDDGIVLRDWAVNYAVRHNVGHLVLHHYAYSLIRTLPRSLAVCRTLKSLELNYFGLPNSIPSSAFTTITTLVLKHCELYGCFDILAIFPNVINLYLNLMVIANEESDNGESEESDDDSKAKFDVLKISGPKLVNLSLVDVVCSEVELSAPNLVSFKYTQDWFWHSILEFSIMHLPSLQHAEVDFSEPDMDNIEDLEEYFCPRFFNLLHGIRNVEFLKLSTPTLEVLNDAGLLEHQTFPFSKLKSLILDVYSDDLCDHRWTLPAYVTSYLLTGANSRNMHIEFQRK